MSGEKERQGPTLKSINDLRAPVMMLAVLAFCGRQMGQVPLWVAFGIMIPPLVVWPFVFERASVRESLAFRPRGLAAGLLLIPALYLAMAGALQLWSDLTVGEGMTLGGGDLPLIFSELLAIKRAAAAVPGPILGLGGALALAPAEELFWRGFVQRRLARWTGTVPGLALTVVLYAGFYMLLIGPLAAAAAAVTGLACALLATFSRSLLPAVLCHSGLWMLAVWLRPLF